MSNEVIIDGVNVAECEFIVNSIPADCDIDTCFCYENPNCYYKQLKRLDETCKTLNQQLEKSVDDKYKLNELINQLQAENEQLKNDLIVKQISFVAEQETNKDYEAHYAKLETENEKLKKEVEDLNFYIDSYRQVWEIDKYRKALEEINLILCEGRTFYDGYFDTDNLSRTDKTIKLINEVLND